MKLSAMAWRTLSRNRRRTLITSLSVAFGIFLAVTFTGAGDYSYTNMINTSAVMGFGHVTVAARGFITMPSLSRWVRNTSKLRAAALRLSSVSGAYPRIMGQAMFAAGDKSAGGMLMGIDPSLEGPHHNFFLRSIVEGRMFHDNSGRGALIGAEMAEKLNLRPGRKLIVTVTDKDGELASELLRIRGIFRTGDHAADSGIVLAPLGRLQQTLGYGSEGASFLAIYSEDLRRVPDIRNTLAGALAGPDRPEVMTWRETQADLAGLIAVDRLFNYLMQLLVGLVIAAGIMNTMLMSVLERTREFGIMLALGMTPGQVARLVLVESFWLGCLGVVLGVVLTAPWFWFMSSAGIDLSRFIGEDYSAGGVLVDPVMKLRLFKESAMVILATVFILTLAAGIYPAIQAGRVMPARIIKEF